MAMTNKTRILFLERYLMENTDREHCLSIQDLVNLCASQGIRVNRETIKDDLQTLADAGMPLTMTKEGKSVSCRVEKKPFEDNDVRALVDAVASAAFLPREEKARLIDKLGSLSGVYSRRAVTAIRLAGAQSLPERSYSEDMLAQAIEKGVKVAFQYIDYNGYKGRIPRQHGAEYIVSPYAMTPLRGRLWLIGYSDNRGKTVLFNVNRMESLRLLPDRASGCSRELLYDCLGGLERSRPGEMRRIELLCDDQTMASVIERFGEDVVTHKVSDTNFMAEMDVRIDPAFFGWLFQHAGKIRVAAPADIALAYAGLLRQALQEYRKTQ